jgi:hypothetical protein
MPASPGFTGSVNACEAVPVSTGCGSMTSIEVYSKQFGAPSKPRLTGSGPSGPMLSETPRNSNATPTSASRSDNVKLCPCIGMPLQVCRGSTLFGAGQPWP